MDPSFFAFPADGISYDDYLDERMALYDVSALATRTRTVPVDDNQSAIAR
jgi:hypothetical protein